MGGTAQTAQPQAQVTNAGSKGAEVPEQHPETPIPLDKSAGEDTERRAPDLNEFWVQASIEDPEFMGMVTTEDLSVPDYEVTSTTRRKARRNQAVRRVATTSKDIYRLPDAYALGSVVCSETQLVDRTVHKEELGIVVQEPINTAEPGCGQKRKLNSKGSGLWVCFGSAKAQKRCDDLLAREK